MLPEDLEVNQHLITGLIAWGGTWRYPVIFYRAIREYAHIEVRCLSGITVKPKTGS
jgi:hypothetical protein